jgi:ABC-type transporter MlaC component
VWVSVRVYYLCKKKLPMDNKDILSKQFSRYMTGFCRSKAIMEDYARVIAKLEGTTEEVVKERIEKRTQEIFDEIKKEIQQ